LFKLIPEFRLAELWPLAIEAAKTSSVLTGWKRRGRTHDPLKLLAALLLKSVPPAKSYRELAKALRAEGLSTGLRRKAYPSKSTLFEVAHSIPLETLLVAVTVLYLKVAALYVGKLGRVILEKTVYAVDSTCISFDSYSRAGRRLLRFAVLSWPVGGAVVCAFDRACSLAGLVNLIPSGAVLAGDGEFWCRKVLLACLARWIAVAIKPRGKAPLGVRVELERYWVRRVCEQVFACMVKRRRVLLARSERGAVVALLLALASHNLVALRRRIELLRLFI